MQPASTSLGVCRQTLLVVDDQPLNIQAIHHALSGEYRVVMAASGAQALEICRQQRPDLILLDVVMPEMDGFEVCTRLKADPLTCDIPIIFVTAHDDAVNEMRCLELGGADFIVKPVNAAVVRARVKTHLGLAYSTAMLAATLQTSTDGILVTNLTGSVVSINRACTRMWGLPTELRLPASHEEVVAGMRLQLPSVAQDNSQPPDPLRGGGPVKYCEVIELAGDRHVERYVQPLYVNGNLRGQVVIFREETERRRADHALLRLNESLESRILERTEALQNVTLQAQAASRAKSDFLSNMSHEIRTPINAVMGLSALALATQPQPKLSEYLQKIYSASEHLLALVNKILDFSKIEAGKLALDEADFELRQVFASVDSVCKEAASAKGLALSFEIAPELSRAWRGDPLRLSQVLLNYVGNAIKFTEQGSVQVRATPQEQLEGRAVIRFEVKDTGVGLSETQVAQLFRSFHQLDASTTRNYGGSGLGLALCKQLAELMGGSVGVTSQLGQGSVFWFTCSLGHGTRPSDEAETSAGALAEELREVLLGARVLLVEDNPLNQEVAQGVLELAGITTTIAINGKEALERLSEQSFDAVLMDVQMPVMDGLQATRLIRQNPLYADLPVLAITANASGEDRARCLDAGMDDYLTKPVLPDRLYRALAQWLKPRSGHSPSACALPDASAAPSAHPIANEPIAPLVHRPATNPDVVDLSILARHVGDDPKKVKRYGDLFVESMQKSVAELEAALGAANLGAVADLGHRLKSSSRLVGALGLASLCESLESLRQGGSLQDARLIVEKIPDLLARISADIALTTS